MAPRVLRMLTCLSINVHVPVPVPADEEAANGSAKNRPWTGEIKRKILASARRQRIRAVREEEPRNANVVEKQSAPERKVVAERQSTTTRGSRPVLKRCNGLRRDDGALEAVAVVAGIVRERKGLRVRFDLPEEETIAAPEPPRFQTGVLGEPPESFAHSDPEMTAAFLMSVTAADGGSATAIYPELVARWTERKEASSRRLRYLRDYCPFRREEGYEEDEESTPETTTLPAEEPDHAEEAPTWVKTGLPFDSPESEDEFAKAIRSRYLLKDDFISRYGAVVQELKAS